MRRPTRAFLGLLLFALLLAAGTAAQERPRVHDVPAGPAAIRGRTDDSGAFAFEGISNAPETAYLVGAQFAGISYAGSRVVFSAGELERELEVRVADVVSDPKAVRVREVEVRINLMGNRLQVSETVRLENQGERSVYVARDARSDQDAAFRTRLPEGAQHFTMALGMVPEGIQHKDRDVAFFGPVYPGEQEWTFHYSLPAQQGAQQFRREFATPLDRVRVLLPETGPEAEAPELAAEEAVTIDGRRYRSLAGGPLPAGGALELALDVPEFQHDPNALSLNEVRMFLELDEAALVSREEYRVAVRGVTGAAGTKEQPLLHITLPDGARNLAFSSAYGLVPSAGGGIDLLGPVPHGESLIEVLYRIPRTGNTLELSRAFAAGFPLLSLFVGDTGLLVESERLHRRRPVRTPDRTYIHLEAFEIEPDETIAMRFVPLPPRAGIPRPALLSIVLIAALGSAAFLSAPLLRPSGTVVAWEAESPARREREVVIAAIRDLDHDYETGKVSEVDHRLLREDLRARAVALLREEREAKPPEVKPSETTPPSCQSCGTEPRDGDRFCARCGTPLTSEPSAGQGASR
jgi:hypothetical protein